MGEAKRRGTKDERVAAARPKERKIGAAERYFVKKQIQNEVLARVFKNSAIELTGDDNLRVYHGEL
jgi:hypothetical protein